MAFITGAARGQGQSHAVRFAEEGADIIAVDLCAQIDSVAYPMATPADLEETVNLVEKTGRRIVAEQANVRKFEKLKAIVAKGVSKLSRIDFVLANAGILSMIGEKGQETSAFADAVDVMLTGVYYTIEAALPALLDHGEGEAIVITSSIAGLTGMHAQFSMKNPGAVGYLAAKHGVVGLMRGYANTLAQKNIRVNTVHPSGTAPDDRQRTDAPAIGRRAGVPVGVREHASGSIHRSQRYQRGDGVSMRSLGPLRHRYHPAGRCRIYRQVVGSLPRLVSTLSGIVT